MQIGGIWSYIVLELLFVTALACLYLFLRNRRLNAVIKTASTPTPQRELSLDTYAELLQKQILEADAKLARLQQNATSDDTLSALVSTRLSILKAERNAVQSSGLNDEQFWSSLGESLREFVSNDTARVGDSDDQSRLIASLQARIMAYEQRIANLEMFKENFFKLKQRHSEASAVNQRLHDEVEKAIPAEKQSPELQEVMRSLKEENNRLEQELSLVEQEFDGIMRKLDSRAQENKTEKPDIAVVNSMNSIGEKVSAIKDFVSAHDEQIKALHGVISELQLELEDQQRLQAGLDKLKAQNNELNEVIDIIQEENTFLQEQISALLKQELETDKFSHEIQETLQAELDQRRSAYAALETKYANMETEYLTVYEENQRLKGK